MFNTWKWRSRLDHVKRNLDRERRLLLLGRIDQLSTMDAQRREAEEMLLKIPTSFAEEHAAEISRIRALAERNARLLHAYIDGVRRGAQRVIEFAKARDELGAYARDGSRIDTPNGPGNCRKKA